MEVYVVTLFIPSRRCRVITQYSCETFKTFAELSPAPNDPENLQSIQNIISNKNKQLKLNISSLSKSAQARTSVELLALYDLIQLIQLATYRTILI